MPALVEVPAHLADAQALPRARRSLLGAGRAHLGLREGLSHDAGGLSSVPSAALARSQRHNLRRIFVQTESGEVVVVEVDCTSGPGGAEKVKRRVQEALNVPTEQADLVFGGQVLEDLQELQNDVPVLLTRRGITRSASSPCLTRQQRSSGHVSTVPATASTFGAIPSSQSAPPPRTLNEGGMAFPDANSNDKRAPQQLSAMFEVVGALQPSPSLEVLIEEASQGIRSGVAPVVASGGTGGAYCFCNSDGKKVVIVKPTDEEPFAPNNPNGYVGRALGQPGLKKAIRVGEAGIREVAAHLLDHQSFAGVPYTALVRAAHPAFNVNATPVPGAGVGSSSQSRGCGLSSSFGPLSGMSLALAGAPAPAPASSVPFKLCSLQQYVHHDYDTSECGTARFPVSAVHRIGILDVRIFNTDRHSGNILVRRLGPDMFERRHSNPGSRLDEAVQLIPIDHGFCLPETLEAAYFEWLHWPQASLPFSAEELEYIASLDVHAEVVMLRERLPMLREGCLRILVLATTLLQRGAAAGLTLAEIGAVMSREVRGAEEVASDLESLCLEAMRLLVAPPPQRSLPAPPQSGLSQSAAFAEPGSPCSSGLSQPSTPGSPEGFNPGCGESPSLFFEFEDGVAEDEEEEEGAISKGHPSSRAGRDTVGPLACPAASRGEGEHPDSPFSPRWALHRGAKARPSSSLGPLVVSRACMRLNFGALPAVEAGPGVSMLGQVLRDAGAAVQQGPRLSVAVPGKGSKPRAGEGAGPGSPWKAPCRHESLLGRRFRPSGGLPQAPGALAPAGLKLGSAGVAARRVKALRAQSSGAEHDIDGALPGGGSFVLSDMEESTWQQFYLLYLDLVDGLVTRKAAERSQGADFFGTSCQW